jgi:hypothetical protein
MLCERRGCCDFYDQLSFKLGLVVFFTTHYCHGPMYAKCARYILHSEGKAIPGDLFPNQTWRIPMPPRAASSRVKRDRKTGTAEAVGSEGSRGVQRG